MDLVSCSPVMHVQTRYVHKGLSTYTDTRAESETLAQKQKQTVVIVDREHRDGCTN